MPFKTLFRILLVFAFSLGFSGLGWAQSNQTSWTSNDDMLLFYEAIVKIQENSLKPEASSHIVNKAIRAYLRQLDHFSDYLPKKQYKAYKRSQRGQYAGVGMDLFQDRSGRFVCVPYPGGPAEKGGVEYGDALTFVNNKSVDGMSVFAVGTMVRGQPGSSVSLIFKTPGKLVKQVSLVRRQIKFKSVLMDHAGKIPVLKVLQFTKSTDRELKEALDAISTETTKVIDLRGNTGGDLYAAINAASLFLESGKKIVDFKSRDGIQSHKAKGGAVDTSSRLFLWQDELTASAAEVFIAALVQNGRAVSIGRTSFGKGVAQGIVELTDGSALFITNGALRTPDGNYYHEQGLAPNYTIDKTIGYSDKEYAGKTEDLIRSE